MYFDLRSWNNSKLLKELKKIKFSLIFFVPFIIVSKVNFFSKNYKKFRIELSNNGLLNFDEKLFFNGSSYNAYSIYFAMIKIDFNNKISLDYFDEIFGKNFK